MFELTKQSAKVAHVNLRKELHGEEEVLACDLKVEAKLPNEFLNQLNPALRNALYERDGGLDLGDGHAAKLRFPFLETPLKWDGEIVGGKVTVHYGVSGDDLVLFADIGQLRLSPQDGGTVVVGFRVQFRPDGSQASQMPFLLGELVEISVSKPVVEDSGTGVLGGDGSGSNDTSGDDTGK